MKLSGALRTVAVFEAAKGALVLLVGFDLLSLVHHDIQQAAEHLLARTHLNPASRYPRILLIVRTSILVAYEKFPFVFSPR